MGLSFSDLVPDADLVMGVKAVRGRCPEAVICFGSRGNAALKNDGYFATARRVAETALARPYLVTIGGGGQLRNHELRGRVLEVVRVTGVYGETSMLVQTLEVRESLKHWPVSVVLLEVYSVAGEPLLVDDLGFPDRRILNNAFDGVRRDPEDVARLWKALASRTLEFRRDINPSPGFRDPAAIRHCGDRYPTLKASAHEGECVLVESRRLGRDKSMAAAAKERNRRHNGGHLACEACGLTDDNDTLFDVHHLRPLAVGVRETLLDHLAVLCPTCHRWAHVKAPDRLQPMPVEAIRLARAEQ